MQGVISLGRRRARLPHARGASARPRSTPSSTATPRTPRTAGLPKLRRLICADQAARYDAHYAWEDECLITTGVSEGLDLALRVLLNPGDEVIVPEPCYVAYEPCVRFAGGVPVPVPTRWEDDFAVDAGRVAEAVTPRTKANLLGSPANPTGAVQPRSTLEALVALAQEHDLYLVSDEIYDRLTYQRPPHRMGARPERASAPWCSAGSPRPRR